MKIAIIGHGFVGKAVDYGFSHPKVEKTIIDPKYGSSIAELDVLEYNAIFVCVPTPMTASGAIDASILEEVLSKLTSGIMFNHTLVIIKSTVTPDIISRYETCDNFIYNPEFLTEKSANEMFVNPPFHVFGGYPQNCMMAEMLYRDYSLCSPCPVFHMTMTEASFVKYAINSFLATKVTFFNQLYDAVADTKANFSKIIRVVGSDPRIGHSHAKVPGFDNKRGFGGACFPKDTAAFANYSDKLSLLHTVIDINNVYRAEYEKDDRELAQNIHYEKTN
jgi:UDPglucose 6-dehydrogenase